ncbi:unnamed protein product [Macrosiphum euphorbiae]|uniref:DNA-directed DNA polymerase n=1 Tax=Macrosiphum euphorbiae TaxID=13131 RepID=A0AAV0Y9R8_9HEMI|nr:unnamed protein product [Macrosiphum euphorbiae]
MFEKGIRGGLTQASMRYAKANNEKTPDYDPAQPKSWLVYQDCNNLYGYAMSHYMPYGGFKWVEPKLDGLNDLNDSSPIGRIFDDKRVILEDKIHTLAHGHYSIEETRTLEEAEADLMQLAEAEQNR